MLFFKTLLIAQTNIRVVYVCRLIEVIMGMLKWNWYLFYASIMLFKNLIYLTNIYFRYDLILLLSWTLLKILLCVYIPIHFHLLCPVFILGPYQSSMGNHHAKGAEGTMQIYVNHERQLHFFPHVRQHCSFLTSVLEMALYWSGQLPYMLTWPKHPHVVLKTCCSTTEVIALIAGPGQLVPLPPFIVFTWNVKKWIHWGMYYSLEALLL